MPSNEVYLLPLFVNLYRLRLILINRYHLQKLQCLVQYLSLESQALGALGLEVFQVLFYHQYLLDKIRKNQYHMRNLLSMIRQ